MLRRGSNPEINGIKIEEPGDSTLRDSLSVWVELVLWHDIRVLITEQSQVRISSFLLFVKKQTQNSINL
jgi:hypothetical protein